MTNRRLTEIWIYPIKSLGGIRQATARIFPKGLQHDRRWMLIDSENRFMTQRDFPQMALFQPAITNGILTITKKGSSEKVSIDITAANGPSISAAIWNDVVHATEESAAVAQWFTTHLGLECRLVRFPEKNPRPVDPHYRVKDGDNVSLADAYPYLLIGQASLDNLNSRLTNPTPMNRFRPNFVFEGGAAFEEDNWKQFSIGGLRFAAVKPCDRCTIPTVDQATGKKGVEPLATLSRFRKKDNKVLFGQNAIALENDGTVSEGDLIEVLAS